MAYKIKIGSKWEDRGSKTIREVLSVTDDGARVQLTDGNGYKAMAVKSLLSNYRERTDLKPSEPTTETPKQPDFSNVEKHITGKVNKGDYIHN